MRGFQEGDDRRRTRMLERARAAPRNGAAEDACVMVSSLPGQDGLHWGLSLPNRGILFGAISVGGLLDLAHAGEDSGFFGSVWIGDSMLDRPRVDSIPLLGALSTVTKRVWLGVSC